jgi:hypothetical protein
VNFVSTHKGTRMYLHLLNRRKEVRLPPIDVPLLRAGVLGGGTVKVEPAGRGTRITVDEAAVHDIDTVVVLELGGPASSVTPIPLSGVTARASNVYRDQSEYTPDRAVDGQTATRWATDEGLKRCWIEIDLREPVTVSKALLDEWAPRVKRYVLERRVGDDWEPIAEGSGLGPRAEVTFEPVTARVFRLRILDASDGPTFNEIEFR